MCVPCGHPWFYHGARTSDYDPETGLLRYSADYEDTQVNVATKEE